MLIINHDTIAYECEELKQKPYSYARGGGHDHNYAHAVQYDIATAEEAARQRARQLITQIQSDRFDDGAYWPANAARPVNHNTMVSNQRSLSPSTSRNLQQRVPRQASPTDKALVRHQDNQRDKGEQSNSASSSNRRSRSPSVTRFSPERIRVRGSSAIPEDRQLILIDSGAGADLKGAELCSARQLANATELTDPVELETANGNIEVTHVVHDRLRTLREETSSLLLPHSPWALSLGQRCMQQGYSFTWPAGENPYFTTSRGTRVSLIVIGNCPYIDETNNVTALPAHIQEDQHEQPQLPQPK